MCRRERGTFEDVDDNRNGDAFLNREGIQMPNPMQRQHDRDVLKAYLERVAHWRTLVQLGEVNPALPTHYGPGSDEKMLLMTLRDEMGLPLNVEGDSRECGHKPVWPSEPIKETPTGADITPPMIRRLMVGVPRVRSMRAA